MANAKQRKKEKKGTHNICRTIYAIFLQAGRSHYIDYPLCGFAALCEKYSPAEVRKIVLPKIVLPKNLKSRKGYATYIDCFASGTLALHYSSGTLELHLLLTVLLLDAATAACHSYGTMKNIAAIEASKLCVSFATLPPKTLFDDFSFCIYAGEHIALTGPSGCGKTTLLRCLLGIVEPVSGEILINGQHLNAESVWKLRGEIAFVPQEADLGRGTVREFVERPFKYRINSSKSGNLKRLPDMMQALGLDTKLLASDISSLSGGEKQRMALISALLLDRPILLLDEVASALDDESAERVFDLLSNLKNKTIIGVVHDGAKMPFATREISVGGGSL